MLTWLIPFIPIVFFMYFKKHFPPLKFKKFVYMMPPVSKRNFYFTHWFIVITIMINMLLLKSFPWEFSILFIPAIIISFISFGDFWYALSSFLQEICVLSFVALVPVYAIPFVLILFAIAHEGWKMGLTTLIWASISTGLFLYLNTIVWSILLHMLVGAIFMQKKYDVLNAFRKQKALKNSYSNLD